MDHLRLLRRLICISISSVHHALLTVAIASDVCWTPLVSNCSSSHVYYLSLMYVRLRTSSVIIAAFLIYLIFLSSYDL